MNSGNSGEKKGSPCETKHIPVKRTTKGRERSKLPFYATPQTTNAPKRIHQLIKSRNKGQILILKIPDTVACVSSLLQTL